MIYQWSTPVLYSQNSFQLSWIQSPRTRLKLGGKVLPLLCVCAVEGGVWPNPTTPIPQLGNWGTTWLWAYGKSGLLVGVQRDPVVGATHCGLKQSLWFGRQVWKTQRFLHVSCCCLKGRWSCAGGKECSPQHGFVLPRGWLVTGRGVEETLLDEP